MSDDLKRAERMVSEAAADYMVLKRTLDAYADAARHLSTDQQKYLKPKLLKVQREVKTAEAFLEKMRGQLRDLQRSAAPE